MGVYVWEMGLCKEGLMVVAVTKFDGVSEMREEGYWLNRERERRDVDHDKEEREWKNLFNINWKKLIQFFFYFQKLRFC